MVSGPYTAWSRGRLTFRAVRPFAHRFPPCWPPGCSGTRPGALDLAGHSPRGISTSLPLTPSRPPRQLPPSGPRHASVCRPRAHLAACPPGEGRGLCRSRRGQPRAQHGHLGLSRCLSDVRRLQGWGPGCLSAGRWACSQNERKRGRNGAHVANSHHVR